MSLYIRAKVQLTLAHRHRRLHTHACQPAFPFSAVLFARVKIVDPCLEHDSHMPSVFRLSLKKISVAGQNVFMCFSPLKGSHSTSQSRVFFFFRLVPMALKVFVVYNNMTANRFYTLLGEKGTKPHLFLVSEVVPLFFFNTFNAYGSLNMVYL